MSEAIDRKVAAIDCGTNSIRLLIGSMQEAGSGAGAAGSVRWVDDVRQMRVVRLGQGVDKTGELAAEALERTFAASADYAELCAAHGVERIRFVATSATRDARNREEFTAGIRSLLGVDPEVISGRQEAELSFQGALAGSPAAATLAAGTQVLVVDIGGGSTEFAAGLSAGSGGKGTLEAAFSADMGCVRLQERFFDGGYSAEALLAARDFVAEQVEMAAADVPLERTGLLVGLAGSITTVTARALDLDRYDPSVIDQAVLPVGALRAAAREMWSEPRDVKAAWGFMHPGRVDVIGAGALVWDEILAQLAERTAAAGAGLESVLTSEHDILDGIALSLLA